MQCRLPRMQTMIIQTFDVMLSGNFSSSHGYVTIDGTTYTSAQTLKVAKGTSVTVHCGANNYTYQKNSIIKLNGTTVAKGASNAAAEYTFAVTNGCSIVFTASGNSYQNTYYSADITMPA